MTPQASRIEMTDLVSYLLTNDLAIVAQTPTIVDHAGGVREVCSPSSNTMRGALIGATGTLWEYRFILRSGDFLVLLYEGSILQMQYTFGSDGELLRHRLAFVPCPIAIQREMVEGAPDLEAAIGMALEEFSPWPARFPDPIEDHGDALRLRGPIRFDFDRHSRDELHSACHAHFSSEYCRVPAFGPLSVGHFVRFIFRHFLHDAWSEHEPLRHWQLRYFDRTIVLPETEELFLDSRRPA